MKKTNLGKSPERRIYLSHDWWDRLLAYCQSEALIRTASDLYNLTKIDRKTFEAARNEEAFTEKVFDLLATCLPCKTRLGLLEVLAVPLDIYDGLDPTRSEQWPNERSDMLARMVSNMEKYVEWPNPKVGKKTLRILQGPEFKAYLWVAQPKESTPTPQRQDEWLDSECSIVIANKLLQQPLTNVLELFRDDELALHEWVRSKIALAIWGNLDFQSSLPDFIAAASPRIKQIWIQECAKYFPLEARRKITATINKYK